jgi:chaperonin GroES
LVRALKGSIIVKVNKKEITTESGIVAPLSDEEQPYSMGVVTSSGVDMRLLKRDDIVLFDDCTKKRFEMDGNLYFKLDPKEIICKVVDGAPVPILDKVIIDPEKDYETTAGGIFIPEEAKPGSCFGKVFAVGDGNIGLNGRLIPLTVLVGEYVYYSQWKKIEIEITGNKYVMTREESIEGILDNFNLSERIEREKWRT